MKIRYLAIAAACAIAPVTAHAEGFLGPRIGVIVGWDDVDINNERVGVDTSWDGTTYGIVTGYNWAIGESAIFGIGTSTMFTDHGKTFTDGVDTLRVETGRDLEISAKLGYIIADAALIYAKLGYANAKVEAERINADGTRLEDDETGSGVRLGIGTEIPIFGSVALLGEYRHSNYGSGFSRNQLVAGLGITF